MGREEVESYWSKVAQRIKARDKNAFVAGDDTPYFRYKRAKFLKRFLDAIDCTSRIILELGCGPGGNLLYIAQTQSPEKLIGVDISQPMIDLAAENLGSCAVATQLLKSDGVVLPVPDQSVDTSFTSTVLHHNTDGDTFKGLVRELCRVTRTSVIVMENTGHEGVSGSGSYIARRVDVYESVFAEHGFRLSDCAYLNTKVSRYGHAFIDRIFPPGKHDEGAPFRRLPQLLVTAFLPVTRILDRCFADKYDMTKMVFLRAR